MKVILVILWTFTALAVVGCMVTVSEERGLTAAQITERTNTQYFERKAAAIRRERQEENDLQYFMLLQDIQRRARQ